MASAYSIGAVDLAEASNTINSVIAELAAYAEFLKQDSQDACSDTGPTATPSVSASPVTTAHHGYGNTDAWHPHRHPNEHAHFNKHSDPDSGRLSERFLDTVMQRLGPPRPNLCVVA